MELKIKKIQVSDSELRKLSYVIVYRSPFDDDEVIAAFQSLTNARRVLDIWSADMNDDEKLVLRAIEE